MKKIQEVKDRMNASMSAEIEARQSDDLWNNAIASRILKKQRNHKQRLILAPILSLATASLIVVGLIINKEETLNGESYGNLINNQMLGTYSNVFTDSAATNANDLLVASDVDSMITETLYYR